MISKHSIPVDGKRTTLLKDFPLHRDLDTDQRRVSGWTTLSVNAQGIVSGCEHPVAVTSNASIQTSEASCRRTPFIHPKDMSDPQQQSEPSRVASDRKRPTNSGIPVRRLNRQFWGGKAGGPPLSRPFTTGVTARAESQAFHPPLDSVYQLMGNNIDQLEPTQKIHGSSCRFFSNIPHPDSTPAKAYFSAKMFGFLVKKIRHKRQESPNLSGF